MDLFGPLSWNREGDYNKQNGLSEIEAMYYYKMYKKHT